MQTVILVIHLLIVIALIGIILIQRSEGGGLGIGGGSGFMTARGTKNALTRFTAILAAGFFVTSILLYILTGRDTSSLNQIIAPLNTPATTTAPAVPGQPQSEQTAPQTGTQPAQNGAPAENTPATNTPATGTNDGSTSVFDSLGDN